MYMTAARTRALALAVILLGSLPSPGSDQEKAIVYEVESVKRKLVREIEGATERLEAGDEAISGQVLRTGWWSSAELQVPEFQSRFVLGSSTRVRLAGELPGVLIDVEKGRLHAIFDRLEGESPPERVVTTPSAVLAVRGTEYAVWVDGKGNTEMAVFKGQVDVLDRARKGEPIRVGPGLGCTIRRGGPPTEPAPHGMNSGEWKHGAPPNRPMGQGQGPGMGTGTGPGSSQMGAHGHGGGGGPGLR